MCLTNTSDISLTTNIYTHVCRPQWPRGVRRGSAADRFLGLRDRIPLGHGCLFLGIVVFCQVDVSAMRRSLFQKSPTECGVSECVRDASIMTKT